MDSSTLEDITSDGTLSEVSDSDASNQNPPTVITSQGPVVGLTTDGISSFLGIPYAAPPVGNLRWRPPQDHAQWTTPRETTTFGLACPQGADLTGQTPPSSEDCLTLNVWTPNPSNTTSYPVMVFIHGGAFEAGSSNKALYEGFQLAKRGNVVAVSINYRLGALGFLAHPGLTAEDSHGSSGNYGILDQQAALRWVQTNIAAFGGDPTNVTIFGESAGGMSVCVHTVSPLSANLFRRAIVQSGPCLSLTMPLHTTSGVAPMSAEAKGEAYARAHSCDTASDVIACLRAKPAEAFISIPLGSGLSFDGTADMVRPNIDGYVLTESPLVSYVNGRINPVSAMIAGVNKDEATIFTIGQVIATQNAYEQAIARFFPSHVRDVIAMYPPNSTQYPTFKSAFNALVTDMAFLCPTRAMTQLLSQRNVPSYLYYFTKVTPLSSMANLGVFHGSELAFVFGNLSAGSGNNAASIMFANQLQDYWLRFASTGNPNATPNPSWIDVGTNTDAYLVFGEPIQSASGLRTQECTAITSWIQSP